MAKPKKPKLTDNQKEYEKQVRRILKLIKAKTDDISILPSAFPDKPKRVSRQRIEALKRITQKSIDEYINKISRGTPPVEITKLHPTASVKNTTRRGRITGQAGGETSGEGRKGNTQPRTEAQIEAAKRNLEKARKLPRTQQQKEASKRNLAKAHKAPRTEAQKEASRRNLEKAREAKKKKKIIEATPESPIDEPIDVGFDTLPIDDPIDEGLDEIPSDDSYESVANLMELFEKTEHHEVAELLKDYISDATGGDIDAIARRLREYPELIDTIAGALYDSDGVQVADYTFHALVIITGDETIDQDSIINAVKEDGLPYYSRKRRGSSYGLSRNEFKYNPDADLDLLFRDTKA